MREELNSIVLEYLSAKLRKEVGVSGVSFEESLMAWALRWAGRPSREQILNILMACFGRYDTVDKILALYPAPTPKRVTREEIYRAINSSFPAGSIIPATRPLSNPVEMATEKILALLSPEETRRDWCEHIGWTKHKEGGWIFDLGSAPHPYPGSFVPETFDICPVAGCHAPRPATEGNNYKEKTT